MSIGKKIVDTAAHVLTERGRDRLAGQHRFVGQPIDRLDGRAKVTGTASFSAEYPIDGLVHAAITYSTISKGAITSIDASAAEQAPGVLKVITHLNAPKMKVPKPISLGDDPSAGATEVKILNTDQILWNGQPVAVVVADTKDRAEHAASLIRVTYAADRGMNSFAEAIAGAKRPQHILGEQPEVSKGDPDAVLKAATCRVDLNFETPPHNHNAIEPHAAIAVWDGDDRLTLYDTSQFTVGTAGSVAEIFGLRRENVRVISTYVGGGFGGKGSLWPYIQLAKVAAKMGGRPVRIALSREGVFRIVGGRTPSRQRVAISSDSSGHISAFIHEGVTAQSTDNDFPEQFSFPPRHLYAMLAYRIGQKVCEVNRVANT